MNRSSPYATTLVERPDLSASDTQWRSGVLTFVSLPGQLLYREKYAVALGRTGQRDHLCLRPALELAAYHVAARAFTGEP